jgi:hypothetical protein
VVEKGEKDRER